MNERVFHNNGMPTEVPLRSMIAGTNKLTADADLAPFFDRLHLRYQVDYLKSRTNQIDMVTEAIARMSQAGRGMTTSLAVPTQVTVAELDVANKESLELNMDESVIHTFFDLHDALRSSGIVVSDRRVVDGMAAVLANGWLRNHPDVQVADLDILAHMWWPLQELAPAARAIILEVANPSEKLALDLMTALDEIQTDFEGSKKLDEVTRVRLGVEAVRNTEKLLAEARTELVSATAGGSDTRQLDELIGRADAFKGLVSKDVFHLPADTFA
jgi:MoxR-like ATPase